MPQFFSEAELPPALRPLWSRNPFRDNEYGDDAMIVDQAIYDRLLANFEGRDENEYLVDIDYEAVSPAMISKKWVVVIDYRA